MKANISKYINNTRLKTMTSLKCISKFANCDTPVCLLLFLNSKLLAWLETM